MRYKIKAWLFWKAFSFSYYPLTEIKYWSYFNEAWEKEDTNL